LFPSTKGWLRMRECMRAAAFVWMSGGIGVLASDGLLRPKNS
jgi:hypothetical protein